MYAIDDHLGNTHMDTRYVMYLSHNQRIQCAVPRSVRKTEPVAQARRSTVDWSRFERMANYHTDVTLSTFRITPEFISAVERTLKVHPIVDKFHVFYSGNRVHVTLWYTVVPPKRWDYRNPVVIDKFIREEVDEAARALLALKTQPASN